MMTPHIAKALQDMFPGTIPGEDYLLQDDGDGPYIKEWRLCEPMPTEAEINKAAARLK